MKGKREREFLHLRSHEDAQGNAASSARPIPPGRTGRQSLTATALLVASADLSIPPPFPARWPSLQQIEAQLSLPPQRRCRPRRFRVVDVAAHRVAINCGRADSNKGLPHSFNHWQTRLASFPALHLCAQSFPLSFARKPDFFEDPVEI